MNDYAGKTIWIIGASSGIGRALAVEMDRRGAMLILSARSEDKLTALNNSLGGRHRVCAIDVTQEKAVKDAASDVFKSKVDSVIFLAGIYQPAKLSALDLELCKDILATNLGGAFNVIAAILPYFPAQIALCASVVGYRGLPNAQPYGATKAGLINLAESLRAEMRGTGIDVRLINPGFVSTPMTAKNQFPMPMMIEPEAAAAAIADGLLNKSFEIHFPKRFTWLLKIARFIPDRLYFSLVP
ncbi:MAG: short chain dehydrogenase family protein [Micavibrio sp.]|nr:short chain dehydrogenase family protein [Micavibrio sp.]